MTRQTIDLWVSGTYPAIIRPKPKMRAQHHHIRDTAPITIEALDDAPLAVAIREGGREHRLLGHDGRLWAPLLRYGKDMDAASLAEYSHDKYFRSPLPNLGNGGTREETKGVVLSDERHLFESRMQKAARDIVEIGGVVHHAVLEPTLRVSWDVGGHIARIEVVMTQDHTGLASRLRLSELDEAMRAVTFLSLWDHDCEVDNAIEELTVVDKSWLQFDTKAEALRVAANIGENGLGIQGLSRLSNETIQAFLDLRRLKDRLDDADFSEARPHLAILNARMPDEPIEENLRSRRFQYARTLLALDAAMGWDAELDEIASLGM